MLLPVARRLLALLAKAGVQLGPSRPSGFRGDLRLRAPSTSRNPRHGRTLDAHGGSYRSEASPDHMALSRPRVGSRTRLANRDVRDVASDGETGIEDAVTDRDVFHALERKGQADRPGVGVRRCALSALSA
jgi:hypothetical protein